MNLKISIIVPVYNTQDYLETCLDSIVNQTYKNLQILLINDGSTDNSYTICKKYKARDSRIELLNRVNSGQAVARNLGLDYATGDYIAFVDSDDAISLDLFAEMAQIISKNSNVSVFQFPIFLNYTANDARLIRFENQLIKGKKQLLQSLIDKNILSWLVCNKLIKKELLNKLRFKEKMIYEDNYFVLDLIAITDSIYICDKGIYYYFKRKNSTTTSKHTLQKEKDTLKVLLHALQFILTENYNTITLLSRIIDVQEAIVYNYKENIAEYQLFRTELNKLSFIVILFSDKAFKVKLKLMMVKYLGLLYYIQIKNYLR